MSTLAVAPTLLDRTGGEPTLDDLLVGVWEGLAAHRAVECPACWGEMEPEYGAHSRQPDSSGAAQSGEAGCRAARRPEGGRCTACGATLR
jgi:hypothetical protein